ncbi:hypothetical protein [Vallitalea okinawensis]|uniref:hypothetical protein n=1 Tax=Vallitalea okinawensis TaxID=2078660 RepID=UPI00130041FC|nr:hypothetical protein [Vallitalea okinawensis]
MKNAKCLRELIMDFIGYASELKETGIITNDQYEHLTNSKLAFLENTCLKR